MGLPACLADDAVPALPQTALTQAYGMTELAPITTLLSPAEHRKGKLRCSVGRATAHAEVRVVDDPDHDQVVPTGTVGEIVARGAHVMLGYWNRPEETAKALRGGWMHTGDAGSMCTGREALCAGVQQLRALRGYRHRRATAIHEGHGV
jgi:long-subunit acyl-CoA synthetase (AMP-forming)